MEKTTMKTLSLVGLGKNYSHNRMRAILIRTFFMLNCKPLYSIGRV